MKERITVRSTNNSKKRNKKLTSIKNITANQKANQKLIAHL